jgi:hypothetical protein
VVTSFFRAGKLQVLTQGIKQRRSSVELESVRLAVDVERHGADNSGVRVRSLRVGHQRYGHGRSSKLEHIAARKIEIAGALHVFSSYACPSGMTILEVEEMDVRQVLTEGRALRQWVSAELELRAVLPETFRAAATTRR